MVGSAIALKLLFGWPLWAGCLLTCIDTVTFLLVHRLGVRYLEALICLLIGIVSICFFNSAFQARRRHAAERAHARPPPPPLARGARAATHGRRDRSRCHAASRTPPASAVASLAGDREQLGRGARQAGSRVGGALAAAVGL